MAYATLAEVRAEGITASQADDDRVTDALDEASLDIDRHCEWFFEPRTLTVTLSGRGTPTLWLPYPPIEITEIRIDGDVEEYDSDELYIYGAPISAPDFEAPYLRLRSFFWSAADRLRADGAHVPHFSEGRENIEIDGVWGYTEDDGTAQGRTPLAIKRACILIAIRLLPSMSDADAMADARQWWRVTEQKTIDQSIKLAASVGSGLGSGGGPFTGDPIIDEILLRFQRPCGIDATAGLSLALEL